MEIADRYGVTILYTAPTAIRSHMKWGLEHAAKHDLSSLRLLESVGEPINPRRGSYHEHIGGGPVRGRHAVADRDGDDPDHAVAGHFDAEARFGDAAVPDRRRGRLRRAGQRGRPRRGGYLVLRKPWPGDDARHLRRRCAVPRDVLGALPRRLLRRRRRTHRRGRGLLASRPSGRRHERVGHRISTIEDDWRSSPRSSTIRALPRPRCAAASTPPLGRRSSLS